MRLATIRIADGRTCAARIDGEHAVRLENFPDVGALLAAPDWRLIASTAAGSMEAVDMHTLAPPVLEPRKILGVGRNFAGHISEARMELPSHPSIFAKFATSLIGCRDPFVLPHPVAAIEADWEVELAAVIGMRLRNAELEQAEQAIAGFMVANDGSVREWQARSPTVTAGKAWDGMTPVGPWLTTADEVDWRSLRLRCFVDDTLMQEDKASSMIFSPAQVVSYASCFVTLEPGDLLLLGTPEGTALGRSPSPWLRAGQILRTEISGLGELRNECVVGAPPPKHWSIR